MNATLIPINFTVTGRIIDRAECSINESAVYQYMNHYPTFSFWLIFIAFMALLLYLYLPMLFSFFRRLGGASGIIMQCILTTGFIGLGVGVILMIPVVFSLSEYDFKVLGIVQNIIIMVGILGLAWFTWKRILGKKKYTKIFKQK